MRVLIDGHNAIFSLDMDGLEPKEMRRRLLALVRETQPEAIVFFDARNASPDMPRTFGEGGVRVVYCHENEADEEILTEVLAAKHPGDVTVVTDDRRLQERVREARARVRNVADALRLRPAAPADEKADAPTDYKAEDFGLPDEIDLDDPNLRL